MLCWTLVVVCVWLSPHSSRTATATTTTTTAAGSGSGGDALLPSSTTTTLSDEPDNNRFDEFDALRLLQLNEDFITEEDIDLVADFKQLHMTGIPEGVGRVASHPNNIKDESKERVRVAVQMPSVEQPRYRYKITEKNKITASSSSRSSSMPSSLPDASIELNATSPKDSQHLLRGNQSATTSQPESQSQPQSRDLSSNSKTHDPSRDHEIDPEFMSLLQLQLEEMTFSPVAGLVADYDFNSAETEHDTEADDPLAQKLKSKLGISSSVGTAPPLADIGETCGRRASFGVEDVKGKQLKVAKFQKGTGFVLSGMKTLVPSGDQTTYTILMRVKFDRTSCFGRVLNFNFGNDYGLYTCDSLRVYPQRGGRLVLSPNVWYDIALATDPQRETFVYVDGTFITAVISDQKVWMDGLSIQSDRVALFNDYGANCNMGAEEETAGSIARLQVFNRVVPLSSLKGSMDRPTDSSIEYETYNDCVCEQMQCECEKYCDCRSKCSPGNLALNRATTQSSTGFGGVSQNAVNGVMQSGYGGNHCTHTGYDFEPWWRVDLTQETSITRVRVLNRGDCCAERINGFEVHVGNEESSWKSNPICGNQVSSADPGELVDVPCGEMKGRYVYISIPGRQEYLHVCGVEVVFEVGFEMGPCVGAAAAAVFSSVSASAAASSRLAVNALASTESSTTSGVTKYLKSSSDAGSVTQGLTPTEMSWVWNSKPFQNFHNWLEGALAVLNEDTFIFISFNLESRLTSNQNIHIFEASLRLFSSDKRVNCSRVGVHSVLSPWEPSTVTWATRPVVSSAPIISAKWGPHQWIEFEGEQLQHVVREWITHSGSNHGLAVTCLEGRRGMDGVGALGDTQFQPRLMLAYAIT